MPPSIPQRRVETKLETQAVPKGGARGMKQAGTVPNPYSRRGMAVYHELQYRTGRGRAELPHRKGV